MSLKDIFSFEQFNLGRKWDQLKKNPERAFIGAMDEFSTKAWNKMLGTNWDPMVDKLGGPTKKDYAAAEEAGIDTGSAKKAHTVTQAIVTSAFGAKGLDKLGGLGGGAGSSAGGSSAGGSYGMSEAGQQAAAGMYDGSSVVELGGSSLEALAGGGGAAGGGAAGGGGGGAAGKKGWMDWVQRGQQLQGVLGGRGQSAPQPMEVPPHDCNLNDPNDLCYIYGDLTPPSGLRAGQL